MYYVQAKAEAQNENIEQAEVTVHLNDIHIPDILPGGSVRVCQSVPEHFCLIRENIESKRVRHLHREYIHEAFA